MIKSKSAPRFPFKLFWRLLTKKDYSLWTYMEDNRLLYGDICRLPFANAATFQVSDPDFIGKILLATEKTNKKSKIVTRMTKVTGNGLIFAIGEQWKKNRQLANPAFHPRMLDRMREVIVAEVNQTILDWKQKIATDPVVNISFEINKMSLRIILKILFSSENSEYSSAVIEEVRVGQEFTNSIFYNPFDLPLWLPTPLNLKIRKAKKVFQELTNKLIEEHRAHPEKYQDLLSTYLATIDDETGESMPDEQIRDEMLTLILAGHETTATSIGMCLSALIDKPEVIEKILEEVKDIDTFTSENTKSLKYAGLVMSEAMRLYPVVWGISREIEETMEYKGMRFEKGTVFILSQQLMHRHPKWWADPLRFIPERFLQENTAGRHPFIYFPFGGGVRNCIGMGLARMEMQIVLSALVKNFRFERSPDHVYKLKPLFTVVPDPYIALRLSER